MRRVQPFNQVEDAAGGSLVQVAGGLVGQQQPGMVDQRAGQCHALLLAAAQLAGPMVAAILQAHFAEPLCRRRERLGFAQAASQQRHGDVFQSRELRQQVMKLPDVADLAIAEGRALARRKLGDVDRGAGDCSGGGRIQRTQNVQQRALARARLADDGHHLAGLNLKIQAAKECERAARGGVSLFQVPE